MANVLCWMPFQKSRLGPKKAGLKFAHLGYYNLDLQINFKFNFSIFLQQNKLECYACKKKHWVPESKKYCTVKVMAVFL